MKLGISYNLFDGYELLESSIKTMKPMVDHISVVFQEISNNSKSTIDKQLVVSLLNRLFDEGVVDSIIEFTPNQSKNSHQNEIDKRQIGYNKAKEVGCTHYLSMDVDEFYIESEFNIAKKIIENNDYDASIVDYANYYGDFNHQVPRNGTEYVPFIYKIMDDRKFEFGNVLTTQYICDPTRQITAKRTVKFKPSDIMMHHMSYVRNGSESMRMKLDNSSANVNLTAGGNHSVDEMVDYYSKWEAGDSGMKIVCLHGSSNRIIDTATERFPLYHVKTPFKYIKSVELSTNSKKEENVEIVDEIK